MKSLKVNGEKQALPFVLPADSKGEYSIEIEMMIDEPKGKINLVKAGPGKCWSPVEPVFGIERFDSKLEGRGKI